MGVQVVASCTYDGCFAVLGPELVWLVVSIGFGYDILLYPSLLQHLATFLDFRRTSVSSVTRWDLAKDAGPRGGRKDGPLPRAGQKGLDSQEQPARLQEHACNLNHGVSPMLDPVISAGFNHEVESLATTS